MICRFAVVVGSVVSIPDGGDGRDTPVHSAEVLVEVRPFGLRRSNEDPPACHEVNHGHEPEGKGDEAHEGRVDAQAPRMSAKMALTLLIFAIFRTFVRTMIPSTTPIWLSVSVA